MIGNDVVETLCQLLESWGPNGERWCKGLGGTYAYDYLTNEREQNFCILGGIGRLELEGMGVAYPSTLWGNEVTARIARTLYKTRRTHSIPGFNDAYDTTFADIKELICDTIHEELAMEEAKLRAEDTNQTPEHAAQ